MASNYQIKCDWIKYVMMPMLVSFHARNLPTAVREGQRPYLGERVYGPFNWLTAGCTSVSNYFVILCVGLYCLSHKMSALNNNRFWQIHFRFRILHQSTSSSIAHVRKHHFLSKMDSALVKQHQQLQEVVLCQLGGSLLFVIIVN